MVGAVQACADGGSAEALALKRRVASGVVEIPDGFFGQMLFDQVGDF